MTSASTSVPTAFGPRLRLRLRLPAILAAGTVGLEISYPLMRGQPRNAVIIVTVVVFFLASTTHSLVSRGARWTALLVAVTAGGGFAVEALGTRTGLPFGHYAYAGTLGPRLAGVPLVIPLAWTMMAYPALVVARRLTSSPSRQALVAGWGLASWDLFLDPQMVAAGRWRWLRAGTALPGVPDVPMGNYLGWLLAAVGMMVALLVLPSSTALRDFQPIAFARTAAPSARGAWTSRQQDGRGTDDRVPYTLYLWTWASSVVANLVFFARPAVAAWGGVAMGLVAVPLIRSLRRR